MMQCDGQACVTSVPDAVASLDLNRSPRLTACWLQSVYLADEQHKLAGVLGDPLGAGLAGVALVASPGQLAQAHCHALFYLAQPCLHVAPRLTQHSHTNSHTQQHHLCLRCRRCAKAVQVLRHDVTLTVLGPAVLSLSARTKSLPQQCCQQEERWHMWFALHVVM